MSGPDASRPVTGRIPVGSDKKDYGNSTGHSALSGRIGSDGTASFLPSGGPLDLDADWPPPHQTHRFGRHMDLRSQSGGVQLFDPSRFDVLRDACRSLRLGVVTESNHLHLSLGAS